MTRRSHLPSSFALACLAVAWLAPAARAEAPTDAERAFHAKLAERFSAHADLARHSVADTLKALQEGGKIVIEVPCPGGTTGRVEITVEHARWAGAKEKGGWCEWSPTVRRGAGGKMAQLKAVIMFDVDTLTNAENSLHGQASNVALYYHELLHVQLLVDAARTAPWQQVFCKCSIDYTASDLAEPHLVIPRHESVFLETLWERVAQNPRDDPWKKPVPAQPPAQPGQPEEPRKPGQPAERGSQSPAPGRLEEPAPLEPPREASFEGLRKATTKVRDGGAWKDGWCHFVKIVAGDEDVHDLHVTLKTPGARFVDAAFEAPPGTWGWGAGKISADGRTLTFEKGAKGRPVTPGAAARFSFKTLVEDVDVDWYFTGQSHGRIDGASGSRRFVFLPPGHDEGTWVASVSPATARPGSVVDVSGSGFGTSAAKVRLTIGGADATVLQASDDLLLAIVPDEATGVGLHVQRGRARSNEFPFAVAPALRSSVTAPLAFERGSVAEVTVEVVGTDEPRAVQLVALDPAVATLSGTVVEERQARPGERTTFKMHGVAKGTAAIALRILAPDPVPSVAWDDEGPSIAGALADSSRPVLLDVTPQRPRPGDPVIVEGAHFGDDAAALDVTLGGRRLDVLEASPTRIVAVLPADALPGSLQVTRGGATCVRPAALDLEPTLRLASPDNVVRRGRQVQLDVIVSGTDEPQVVDLTCTTPAIATLAGGSLRTRVVTSGGARNSASLSVQTLQPGEFHVLGETRGRRPEAVTWLDVGPWELVLAPGERTSLRVEAVTERAGALAREEVFPDAVVLLPAAGTSNARGDLVAGRPGEHLVVVQARGMSVQVPLRVVAP